MLCLTERNLLIGRLDVFVTVMEISGLFNNANKMVEYQIG